jgi:hypothetical protein
MENFIHINVLKARSTKKSETFECKVCTVHPLNPEDDPFSGSQTCTEETCHFVALSVECPHIFRWAEDALVMLCTGVVASHARVHTT